MAVLVTISCPTCPRELQVRAEYVGKRVACKFCAGVFRVPHHTYFSCPNCRREGMVRTEYLGRKVRCKSCDQVFRARSKDSKGRTHADFEVKRLTTELERREGELAELRGRLDDARKDLVSLDIKTRTLTDERDVVQRTQEWAVVEEDLAPSCTDGNGTEPDLPLADLHDSDSDSHSELEPLTRFRSDEEPQEPDLTRTRFADPDGRMESLRAECSRLREEVETYRENAERTVITRDKTELLEQELQVARADSVRLATERDELRVAAESWMNGVHERDTALMLLARERDESRAAFDFAETARLAILDELHTTKQAQSEVQKPQEPSTNVQTAGAAQIEHLSRERDQLAQSLAEWEVKFGAITAEIAANRAVAQNDKESLIAEIARLKDLHHEAAEAHRTVAETVERTEAENRSLAAENAVLAKRKEDAETTLQETSATLQALQARNETIEKEFDQFRQIHGERVAIHEQTAESLRRVIVDKDSVAAEASGRWESEKRGLLDQVEQLRRVQAENETAAAAWKRAEAEKQALTAEVARLKHDLAQKASETAPNAPESTGDPASWEVRGREAEKALSRLRFQFDASEADRKSARQRMAQNDAQFEEWKARAAAIATENLATIREWRERLQRAEADRDAMAQRLEQADKPPSST